MTLFATESLPDWRIRHSDVGTRRVIEPTLSELREGRTTHSLGSGYCCGLLWSKFDGYLKSDELVLRRRSGPSASRMSSPGKSCTKRRYFMPLVHAIII
jgi:hypothetical protein